MKEIQGKVLEKYWVPSINDIELGSIPIDTIVLAWMEKKEHCKKAKINKHGVEVVFNLLEKIPWNSVDIIHEC